MHTDAYRGRWVSRLICTYAPFHVLAVFSSYSVLFYLQKFNFTFILKSCVCQKRLVFPKELNFCRHKICFFTQNYFCRPKLARTVLISIKQHLRYTLYFSRISYFEKTMCGVAQEIRYTFFFFILCNKLFNTNIYRVCLILLLLLLNVIAFPISQLKLKTFARIILVVHKSSCPLKSSAIMKVK